jgi:hypothetical protein
VISLHSLLGFSSLSPTADEKKRADCDQKTEDLRRDLIALSIGTVNLKNAMTFVANRVSDLWDDPSIY